MKLQAMIEKAQYSTYYNTTKSAKKCISQYARLSGKLSHAATSWDTVIFDNTQFQVVMEAYDRIASSYKKSHQTSLINYSKYFRNTICVN